MLFASTTNGLMLGQTAIVAGLKQVGSEDISWVIYVFSTYWPFWLILGLLSSMIGIALLMRNLRK